MTDSIWKDFLTDYLHQQGLSVLFYRPPYADFSDYDLGLRHALFDDFDPAMLLNAVLMLHGNQVAKIVDHFLTYCYFFSLPVSDDPGASSELCCIGPFLLEETSPNILEILDSLHLPFSCLKKLESYYNGIPTLQNCVFLESFLSTFFKYSCGYPTIQIDELNLASLHEQDAVSPLRLTFEEDNTMPAAMMERRYQYENDLLEAVSQGNYSKALEAENRASGVGMADRPMESVRQQQTALIIMNTLLRKAVQQVNVHPFHIHTVSNSFFTRIESASSPRELRQISHDMIRKYCLLVQNHSLSGYSHVVASAINYIDIHLTEVLSLHAIAADLNVSDNYLSSQFKKELGETITSYINFKKLSASLTLLITTDLPIQQVAERVGIFDENYYSRLFKRIYQMSPREYRKRLGAS